MCLGVDVPVVGFENSRPEVLNKVLQSIVQSSHSAHKNRYRSPDCTSWVRIVCAGDPERRKTLYLKCAKTVAEHVLATGWNLEIIATLPFGFALPVREMLHALRRDPPEGVRS